METKTYDFKFKYWQGKGTLSFGRYSNNRIAIQVMDEEGLPVCKASVNFPDDPCPPGHVYIKTWSENAGVLSSLVQNNIVETVRYHESGAVLCRLLVSYE